MPQDPSGTGAARPPAPASPRPPAPEGSPDARTRRRTRLVGAGLLTVLVLWMTRSYLAPLGWAVIIALGVWPLYRRIRPRAAGLPVAAPLLVTGLLAVVLLVPIVLALVELGREAQSVIGWIADVEQHGIPVPDWAARLPLLGQSLEAWWRTHLSAPRSAGELLGGLDTQAVTAWSRTLGGAAVSRLLDAVITFVTLFLLLRHGEGIGTQVLEVTDRWLGRPGERLAEK
ncbi:MAG TPA: AI-2E family transporter, partial [Microvirga sp.]|nr:AI-2E family transporter [Microvirga sp.]